MSEEIKERMRALSTEELLRIVEYKSEDYTSQALATARDTLASRTISEQQRARLEKLKEEEEKAKQASADEPLSLGTRLLLFFFPISILFFLVLAEGFRQRGEHRKAKDVYTVAALWAAIFGIFAIVGLVRLFVFSP